MKGFTLIEVMIITVIIGIMMAIIIPKIIEHQEPETEQQEFIYKGESK